MATNLNKSTESLHSAEANEKFLFTNQDSVEECIHAQEESKEPGRPYPAHPKDVLNAYNVVDYRGDLKELKVRFMHNVTDEMLETVVEAFRLKIKEDTTKYDVAECVALRMNELYGHFWICAPDNSVQTFNDNFSIAHFLYLTVDDHQTFIVYHEHVRSCSVI